MMVRARWLVCTLALSCLGNSQNAWGQEERREDNKQEEKKAVSAYDALWAKLTPLLASRDYGAARALLESKNKSPEFAELQEQLASDGKDVHLLQGLKEAVLRRCRCFKTGDKVVIGVDDYQFVRFEEGLQGEQVVIKFSNDREEMKRALALLPAKTWLTLAEKELPTNPGADKYLIGLFHAVDRQGNREEAARNLKAAASTHPQALRWIERLEAVKSAEAAARKTQQEVQRGREEANKKAEQEKAAAQQAHPNRVAGAWRFIVKPGQRDRKVVDVTLLAKGQGTAGWTWTVDASGTFTLLGPVATFTLELDSAGRRMDGHDAGGRKVEGHRTK